MYDHHPSNCPYAPKWCDRCNENEWPGLPEWAESVAKKDAYLTVNAQLNTKDGRKCGNARVVWVGKIYNHTAALVKTDIGNEMRLTESELKELFYPPEFIMKPLGPVELDEVTKHYVQLGMDNMST